MQTHGNLTASYLWQPGEFARRMLGERPSPVPPTRELWPPPQQPLSISTLHVAYLQDEPPPRRTAPLPPPTCPVVPEHEYTRPRVCTVGTNTDPPPTILSRIRTLVKRNEGSPNQPVARLTAVPKETSFDVKEEENPARKAFNRIQKAITGAKYKIAPGTEAVESPKIVYDISKPGDRMQTTFGQEERSCCKMPTREEFHRRLRAVGGWFRRRPRMPPRRQAHLPRLQITQVIALICGLLVVILMVLGLASADWLMAAGWRQGLFMHCIDPEAPTPLPFDIIAQPGCYAARPAPYIKAAAGLCVATLAADVCGALLTGLGLRSTDHRTKFRYYRFAVLAMSLALMCILIALVIYPVCFAAELNLGNRSVWEFGWAYGVGWGAAIFLFGAVVLLLCDKESEEVYYKERKVVSVEGGGRP
ncbi:uncharacterized protein LOC115447879 isoform X2 [Manduca sexta]|uniref:uncharacterized protein LOC115447879 isoform X2 n=1 Tax=Manduca sexta TaxID=7130 RepID=UPI001182E60C|nr:uncharacterized protein LOC115447879 isoform X2 [Manduca sexta]